MKKAKFVFTKNDCLVILFCAGFVLMCMGAISGGSQNHAKDIVCRSNLRQWNLAMVEFTNDNNGNFWMGWNGATPSESSWWISAVKNYSGKIDDIRFCPTATQTRYAEDGKAGPGWGKEPFTAWGYSPTFLALYSEPDSDFGSYGANGWLENKPDSLTTATTKPKYWKNINTIANAETVPFLLDAQWIDFWPEANHAPPAAENDNWQIGSQFVRVVQNRHGEKENCAFIDGTVRNVGLKELWKLKWHRLYDTNGRWTLAGGATSGMWPNWMRDMEDY